MAYKCLRSTFAGRLYKEDEVYDSIGTAAPKFFQELADVDEAQVIETGLLEEESVSSDEAPAPVKSERDEIKEALTELEVEFKGNASTDSLKELLLEAQSNALMS